MPDYSSMTEYVALAQCGHLAEQNDAEWLIKDMQDHYMSCKLCRHRVMTVMRRTDFDIKHYMRNMVKDE